MSFQPRYAWRALSLDRRTLPRRACGVIRGPAIHDEMEDTSRRARASRKPRRNAVENVADLWTGERASVADRMSAIQHNPLMSLDLLLVRPNSATRVANREGSMSSTMLEVDEVLFRRPRWGKRRNVGDRACRSACCCRPFSAQPRATLEAIAVSVQCPQRRHSSKHVRQVDQRRSLQPSAHVPRAMPRGSITALFDCG